MLSMLNIMLFLFCLLMCVICLLLFLWLSPFCIILTIFVLIVDTVIYYWKLWLLFQWSFGPKTFCKWWWLLVLVKILQSHKYNILFGDYWNWLKAKASSELGGLSNLVWADLADSAISSGHTLWDNASGEGHQFPGQSDLFGWTVEQALAQWILSLAVLAAFSGGIRMHQTW